MNHRRGMFLAALISGMVCWQPTRLLAAEKLAKITASTSTSAAASAAKAFLGSLDDSKRSRAQFAFDDEAQRKNWSNLPTGIFDRKGVRLGELTPSQRTAAMELLSAVLSKAGYDKVIGILEGEETLRTGSNGKLVFGHDEYYLSFLGAPSTSAPWSLQFGGHHLALNLNFNGEHGTLTPSHTATQPAKFNFEGKTLRPLGQETDLSFALVQSLNDSQRKEAIVGAKFRDLVLGPGNDGKTLAPEGVKVSTFDAKQRETLLALVRQWVGILPDYAANPKMAEIQAGLNDTWFLWSGPTETGSPAYFRIQGPAVFIEFAPQSLGGDPTQHLHTMYRDPTNEYGRKWLKK